MAQTPRQQRVQENYDRLSRWYDLMASSEYSWVLAGLKMLNIQPGEQVLEVGVGTGRGMLALASQAVIPGRLVGLDISSGMLQVAAHKINQKIPVGRIHLLQANMLQLPFLSSTFDVAWMSFTLELWDDLGMVCALHELRRVLRSAGRLGIVALEEVDPPGLMSRFYRWTHEHYPEIIDCRAIPVERVLQQAGFEVNAVQQKKMWGLPVIGVVAQPVKVIGSGC